MQYERFIALYTFNGRVYTVDVVVCIVGRACVSLIRMKCTRKKRTCTNGFRCIRYVLNSIGVRMFGLHVLSTFVECSARIHVYGSLCFVFQFPISHTFQMCGSTVASKQSPWKLKPISMPIRNNRFNRHKQKS